MPPAKAAIILHGIGTQGPGYSEDLQRNVRESLRFQGHDPDKLAMVEVCYADLLDVLEREYMAGVLKRWGASWRYAQARRLVMEVLADATMLRPGTDGYIRVQVRIMEALDRLANQLDGYACPLVWVTHSLGGWVAYNYLRDGDANRLPAGPRPLPATGATTAGVVSMGCNIPMFLLTQDVRPLPPFPLSRKSAPWLNLWDPEDVLGMPLAPLGEAWGERVMDVVVDVGPVLAGATPLSHIHYWTSKDVADLVAGFLQPL